MDILLSGICGHMGCEILAQTLDPDCDVNVAVGVDHAPSGDDIGIPIYTSFDDVTEKVDCVVDFSHHSATQALTSFAIKHSLPLVIATTGQTAEEKAMIEKSSETIPVFFAANFSIGVALLCSLAKKAAAVMDNAEIEIVEIHHDRKLDAPSGTALAIADAVREVRPESNIVCGRSGQGKREKNDIGINSVRIGNVVGVHEVLVGTKNETITLKHEAHSRALFANGAIAAARFIYGKPSGLYSMNDMIQTI